MSARNVAVRVTPDAVRQVRGGSPWVFDGSIDSVTYDADPGTVAVLFDRKRQFVGVGLYDPFSPIRVRVLHVGDRVSIDDRFITERVTAAVRLRDPLRDAVDTEGRPTTTAYRLINGENDGLPGLIVDRYAETLVMKWYTVAWAAYVDTVIAALVDQLDPATIVLRLSRAVSQQIDGPVFRRFAAERMTNPTSIGDGQTVYGPAPDGPVEFSENGLVLEADVIRGQKTGHFLDQRDNRARVGVFSSDSDVLDVFASSGGFSVAALAGGARSVTLIDQSSHALRAARRNIERNADRYADRDALDDRVAMFVGDAFVEMEQMIRDRKLFDVVIVDPPAFAQNQASIPAALAAYDRLTVFALGLLSPGGVLVQCSCSSRIGAEQFFESVLESAQRIGRPLGEIERTLHALDHPIGFEYGGYLKALFAYAP